VAALRHTIEQMQPQFPVTVIKADCTNLPFANECFDTVISSFSLCSLENPDAGIREMCRVVKDIGKILFLERGVFKRSLVRWIMRKLDISPNPRIPWEYGYYEDRDPIQLIKNCDVPVLDWRTKHLGDIYLVATGRPSDVNSKLEKPTTETSPAVSSESGTIAESIEGNSQLEKSAVKVPQILRNDCVVYNYHPRRQVAKMPT